MVCGGFVAVHLGAGIHSIKKEPTTKKLCKFACEKGVSLLKDGNNVLDVACQIASVLEDDPLTNAGYGSNLNINGEVECDASIMLSSKKTGTTHFGAVSALRTLKNPVLLAKEIIEYQYQPRILGRIPPMLLVGDGASQFAEQHKVPLVTNQSLISKGAFRRYQKYKERLRFAQVGSMTINGMEISILPEAKPQDTIGVICIDDDGNIASVCSSGGAALKLPGRVGQSATYGCGCWAQHSNSQGIAVITSGNGEQLIQTMLAKTIGSAILRNGEPPFNLHEIMKEDFMHSDLLRADIDLGIERMGGALVAYHDENTVDFNVAFTTESMAYGYMSCRQKTAKVRVSRRKQSRENVCSPSLTMEGYLLKL